jgi:hypothetical protein
MRIAQEVLVFDRLTDEARPEADAHLAEVRTAVGGVHWPPGNDRFVIPPARLGNGVLPIKQAFQILLRDAGWTLEALIVPRGGPGKMDATRSSNGFRTAVEWETGNISSSHRAINKMALAVHDGLAAQGVLVMPTRATSRYLTDRIGNFEELAPYLPVWSRIEAEGRLLIVVVAHDALDASVAPIGKLTDGRALR